MKKILVLTFGLIAVAANGMQSPDYTVNGTEVITSCGKRVSTVSSSFFNSMSEYTEYLRDLNEINCGTRDLPRFIDHITNGY